MDCAEFRRLFSVNIPDEELEKASKDLEAHELICSECRDWITKWDDSDKLPPEIHAAIKYQWMIDRGLISPPEDTLRRAEERLKERRKSQ